MRLLMSIVFIIAMFFAWAIGGEYRFGKGRRGFLLAVPMTLYGLGIVSPLFLALQVGVLYAIYQVLFYDDGIKLVYEKKDNRGWIVIFANGAMIGLTGCVFGIAENSIAIIGMGVIAGILGFIQAVELSNDFKYSAWRIWLVKNGPQYLPYKDDHGRTGYYINFKDAWWVSEGLVGLVLGATIALCVILRKGII